MPVSDHRGKAILISCFSLASIPQSDASESSFGITDHFSTLPNLVGQTEFPFSVAAVNPTLIRAENELDRFPLYLRSDRSASVDVVSGVPALYSLGLGRAVEELVDPSRRPWDGAPVQKSKRHMTIQQVVLIPAAVFLFGGALGLLLAARRRSAARRTIADSKSLRRTTPASRSRQAARLPVATTATSAFICATALLAVFFWQDANQFANYNATLLLAVGSGLVVSKYVASTYPSRTLWFYFCCVFCVFHFGLAPIFLFPAYMSEAESKFSYDWYWDFLQTREAHVVSLIFFLGLLSANVLPKVKSHARTASVSNGGARQIFFISNCVLVASCIVWLILMRSTGGTDYVDFMNKMRTSGAGGTFGYVHGAIDAAFLLGVLSGRALLPLSIFFAWGLIGFTLGLRRELAFPLVVAIGILVSQRRLLLPMWSLALGAVLFLGFSALVSVSRVSGGVATGFDATAVASGLAELGGSLLPVREVINWVDGDGFQLGETYYAPFERTVLKVFPLADRIPAEKDPRLMNVLIESRLGPFGFSIAAEAYYNFSRIGTFLVGGLVGWLLLVCGNTFSAGRISIVAVALSIGLFVHIRQSFVTAFGATATTLIFGFVILGIARLANNVPDRRVSPPVKQTG